MSDDGEPTGTAGPPILAVVRGASAGDFTIVVTRYFGGTKLGTGGLVRAYTESAQAVLAVASFEIKRDNATIGIELPYSLFELVRRVLAAHNATVLDETFAEQVTVLARIERDREPALAHALSELSAGSISPVILD
jgi:putative IMPACT (imprinted ancient) family translation regulator